MEYKEIIDKNVEKAKSNRDKENTEYWNWIISNLVADLEDFNTKGKKRWEGSIQYTPSKMRMRSDPFKEWFNAVWKDMTGEDLPF